MEDFDAFMENDVEDDFAGLVMLKLPFDSFVNQAMLVVGEEWKELGKELLEGYPEALKIFKEKYL